MIFLRQSVLSFIVLALLSVQYGSLLHAVEHPFHAHETESHHHSHDAHDDHHESDEQFTDAGINCDVFFAGERLAQAALYVPPSAVFTAEHARYAVVYIPFVQQRNKLRPRSRSPPAFLT